MMDHMMPSVLSPMPLLHEFQHDNSAILRHSSPAYEISEEEKDVTLSVDLPGVRPEDCKVELENEGHVLHLHGGRNIETEGGYSETRFDQRFTLGKNIDAQRISANLADGVMVVTAPKLAPELLLLLWICKMISECNKYAFSTLSEVVIQDLRVVIRDLQRQNVWIIKFQTNGTFSLARRITVYLEPPILATSVSPHWLEV
jgi:HSP20 family protein